MSSTSSPLQQEVLAWPPPIHGASNSESLFHARAFGSGLADIDLPLSASSQPNIVTYLLQSCLVDAEGRQFDADEIWSWSVKRRMQGMLAIVAATVGTRLSLTPCCTNTDCGEQLEIELQLHDFIDVDEAPHLSCRPEADVLLTLRLPTGRDQLNWQQQVASSDSCDAIELMGKSLISQCNGRPLGDDFVLPAAWLDSIDEQLDAADGLTALTLTTHCPSCSTRNEIALDLETCLLKLLTVRRHNLLEQIHLIASTYHWSEEEVMSIPISRRKFYIDKIVGGVGQ